MWNRWDFSTQRGWIQLFPETVGPPYFPKMETFLWKLLNSSNTTKENLVRRQLLQSATCEVCGNWVEDLQHLFRMCYTAKRTWISGSLGIHSENQSDILFSEWLLYYIEQFYSQDEIHNPRGTYFISTLWALQTARNNHMFRAVVISQDYAMFFYNTWCEVK